MSSGDSRRQLRDQETQTGRRVDDPAATTTRNTVDFFLFLEGALLIVCLYCNPGARALPSSLKPRTKQDEPFKELPKFSVKLFLHSSGHVAVKFQYDQVIISAFRRIPRASWNAKERLWMFPLSSLSEAEKVLGEISNYKVQLEVVKAKVKSPKSKDESESLKFTQKNLINKVYSFYCNIFSGLGQYWNAKIPAVLEYLGTVIEDHKLNELNWLNSVVKMSAYDILIRCKFLIFAHHQPTIDAIHEWLLKKKVGCIWIDGGTPAAQGNNWLQISRKRLYQGSSGMVLFFVVHFFHQSIKAGEVGLTLTAASTVIFAEQSWTPDDLIQAEDRAHRIGHVSSVNIYYLLANDMVDDIIWDVVQFKPDNLGQMLDGHENTLAVSNNQPLSSPAKHTTIEHSPSRQRTLDQFVRRCDKVDRSEHQPDLRRTCQS
ncbi:SWI/SNF-related matrix-associated actin-dependent regulator of chromatin subfamily A-like protein [Arachis hypogaea]|nr:SWI/SNF-related matrix-associated actin-dependent regulator of chromatin subfamily A-like protein [Arachis hypogaea]